jgi:hypothetical protein
MVVVMLSQLIMELEQIAREFEAGIQRREEVAAGLEAVGEQLFRLSGRVKRGEDL